MCDTVHDFSVTVFNLANGVDVEQTKARVEAYKKENQTLILKNRDRQVTILLQCILSVFNRLATVCSINNFIIIYSIIVIIIYNIIYFIIIYK